MRGVVGGKVGVREGVWLLWGWSGRWCNRGRGGVSG